MDEVINVRSAMVFGATEAATQLKFKGRTYRDIVKIFVRRARDVDADGNGKIKVAWRESRSVGDLKTRRYSGFRGPPPAWLPSQEKTCDAGFLGLSAFGLP
eukprot:15120526-Alexandrium_andersonii.AAC.1